MLIIADNVHKTVGFSLEMKTFPSATHSFVIMNMAEILKLNINIITTL